MNNKGTGKAVHATAPKILHEGPTPKRANIGRTANGSPLAKILRRNVFADTADAAYNAYVSTRKLMHCWNMILNPAPMKAVATVGMAQLYFGLAVHPNQKIPPAKKTPPISMGGSRASGTARPLFAATMRL